MAKISSEFNSLLIIQEDNQNYKESSKSELHASIAQPGRALPW
jgi:hypothetical protein